MNALNESWVITKFCKGSIKLKNFYSKKEEIYDNLTKRSDVFSLDYSKKKKRERQEKCVPFEIIQ